MFANAYELVSSFTKPMIVSVRFFNKRVQSIIGSYVILNSDGWIVTVAHMFDFYVQFERHKNEIRDYEQELESVRQDSNLKVKQRNRRMCQVKSNPDWVINHSLWWGREGVELKDLKAQRELDIAIARLEPFDSSTVKHYPVIKDPSKDLRPGTSLCRLGFPFHSIETSFNEAEGVFKLSSTGPPPLFPLEGIYTRNVIGGRTKSGKYEKKLLETSSPGLRGQSGGPIFDANGTVWAIQSSTHHYALGFNPKLKRNGKTIEENQFLSVGWGVHPEVLVAFLRDNGIAFQLSDY